MMEKPSRTRIPAAAALAFAVMALGGCPMEAGDPAATPREWSILTHFIAEFVRAALAAWAR